jgi:glucosamine kinase
LRVTSHIGLDIGGTASRWVLCGADGRELGRGKAGGATGHVFNPAEKDKLRGVLDTIAAHGRADFDVLTVTAGLTGYGGSASPDITALIVEAFGVAPDRVVLIDDVALAYAANFAPGEGLLVSAGTGSIGIHIDADGSFVRVGGRGILIDDAGSGSWIALRALDRMYRALDHDGSFSRIEVLARHVFAHVGGRAWTDVRQFVYGGDRGRIGTLAVAVAQAAQEGDGAAEAILRDAGTELAALAAALIARAGPRPVGFVGRVLELHPAIVAQIRRSLDGQDVRILSGDAGLAAARLQLDPSSAWAKAWGRGFPS